MPPDQDQQTPPPEVDKKQEDRIAGILVKAQIAVGVVLAVVAGVAFARAIMAQDAASWWIGGVCLAIGSILTAFGLAGSKRRTQRLALLAPRAPKAVEPPREKRDPGMPMLGALLVHKYQIITEGQLHDALEEQRARAGEGLPLGQVLREMGLVTDAQLQEALHYQKSRSGRTQVSG